MPPAHRALRILLPAMLLLLVACGSGGKPRRVYPPTASIQQLIVLEDGRWELEVRLQNFSNVGMRVEAVDARLLLENVVAAELAARPGLVVPAGSVEVLELLVSPDEAARMLVTAVIRGDGAIDYTLTGTIRSSEPDQREDEFEFSSALAPVPGLQGILR